MTKEEQLRDFFRKNNETQKEKFRKNDEEDLLELEEQRKEWRDPVSYALEADKELMRLHTEEEDG